MKTIDIVSGIGLLLLSAWVYLQASAYKQSVIYIYGPNFFPQILSVCMALCAIAMIVNAVRGKALKMIEQIELKGFLRLCVSIVICIAYLLLMQVIGFAISTMVFLFVLMAYLGQESKIKRIAASIFVALVVWAIFRYFLVIPLPTGYFDFTF